MDDDGKQLIVERVCSDHAGGCVRVTRPAGTPCPLCASYAAEQDMASEIANLKSAFRSLADSVLAQAGVLQSLAYTATDQRTITAARDASDALVSAVEENEPDKPV